MEELLARYIDRMLDFEETGHIITVVVHDAGSIGKGVKHMAVQWPYVFSVESIWGYLISKFSRGIPKDSSFAFVTASW